MDKQDKQARKELREAMKSQHGDVFAFPLIGATVVVIPCAGSNSDFVRVSVAQCDFKDDGFKKKRGELIALERWIRGQSVAVRTFGRDAETIAEQMADVLSDTVM